MIPANVALRSPARLPVSAMAALDGNPDLALGNAIGSNIVNAGLILGLTALIAPISSMPPEIPPATGQ